MQLSAYDESHSKYEIFHSFETFYPNRKMSYNMEYNC